MELDEMKNLWMKMDESIQKNQALNEHIITRMLQDKSTTALQRMANIEYIGIVVCSILILVFSLQLWNLNNNSSISICYGISIAIITISLLLCIYKIKYLSHIKPAEETVSEIAEKVERFRLLITKERAVSIALMPIIIFVADVVAYYSVYKINILDDLPNYSPRIIIVSITAIVVLIVLYKRIYFENIKRIRTNLNDIDTFCAE